MTDQPFKGDEALTDEKSDLLSGRLTFLLGQIQEADTPEERDAAWDEIAARVEELERDVEWERGVKEDALREANQARKQVAKLREVLGGELGCIRELEELGASYTQLRKETRPPYISYASYSLPAAREALADSSAEGTEK